MMASPRRHVVYTKADEKTSTGAFLMRISLRWTVRLLVRWTAEDDVVTAA